MSDCIACGAHREWPLCETCAQGEEAIATSGAPQPPFVGRKAEQGALWRWLHGDQPSAALLLTGRAGVGKTRLARELVHEIRDHDLGWCVVVRSGRSWPAAPWFDGEGGGALSWRRPVLLIVDDAEAAALPLAGLFRRLEAPRQAMQPRFRALVLGRELGEWSDVVLRAWMPGQDGCDSIDHANLQPFSGLEERRQLFSRALRCYGLDAEASWVDECDDGGDLFAQLARDLFATPLMLMLAAETSVDGLTQALSCSRLELVTAGANRRMVELERRFPAIGEHRDLLWRLVAVALLQGDVAEPDREAFVDEELSFAGTGPRATSGGVRRVLVDGLSDCLQALSRDCSDVVQGFFALGRLAHASGEAGEAGWQDWLGAVERCACRRGPATLARLARIGQDSRGVSELSAPVTMAILHVAARCPEDVPAHSLADCVDSCSGGDDVRRRGHLAVSERVYDCLRRRPADGATAASSLARVAHAYSLALLEAGAPGGVSPAQESVALYRSLVTADPRLSEQRLARSLENLSNHLSVSGRAAEALTIQQEATGIGATWAARSSTYVPAFANSLARLSHRLSELGRAAEALARATETVELYRWLNGPDHDSVQPFDAYLSHALSTLSMRLSDLGRSPEALDAIDEAVFLYRRAMPTNPAPFRAHLATALVSHANRLSEVERHTGALVAIEEAVELFRELALTAPRLHAHNLAGALSTLALIVGTLGQPERALSAATDSTEQLRTCLRDGGETFRGDLAVALGTLAGRLREANRHDDAIDAARESSEHWRALYERNRSGAVSSLAVSLRNLGILLAEAGDAHGALSAAEETTALYAEGVRARPELRAELGHSLRILSRRQLEAGRDTEAVATAIRAVEHWRAMAEANPDLRGGLGQTLLDAAIVFSAAGHHGDALAGIDEWFGLADAMVMPPEALALAGNIRAQSRHAMASDR